MLAYDPKDWFTFIFRLHKSDTFRSLLPLIVGVSAYSAFVAWLELEVWQLSGNSYVRNLTLLHNLLGFVLSLLMVFRTNTAYERWWEGRKAWGALTNNSRNLAIFLDGLLDQADTHNREFFRQAIALYAAALHKHLRAETTRLALDTTGLAELAALDPEKHQPNQVASLISRRIYRLHREGKVPNETLLTITPMLQAFTDVCGICERIKNTPIPYSYSAFIKKFIFIYVMTLPFGYVFSLGYYMAPVVGFVLYVLASLEVLAEEIEDPFSGDVNDLPTDKIATNIRKQVAEVL
ncbi:MAG: bestrophin family ion channel [Bacteroidia bacterium]